MRHFLLILCFACLYLSSFAQPINSWPTADAWWEIRYYDDFGNPTWNRRVRHLDGDTVIQGQTYQRVMQVTYEAATRSDSLGKVFVVPKDSTSEFLLYDFSAQLGDTIFNVLHGSFGQPLGTTSVKVLARDTVSLLDGPHLRMVVEPINNSGVQVEIFDAVGAMNDFLYPMYMGSLSGWDRLVCMNLASVKVITGECLVLGALESTVSRLDIYPNPATNQVRIDCENAQKIHHTELLDASGKLLRQWGHLPSRIDLSLLPSGLYILHLSGEGLHHTQKIMRY